jgi:hypothetical protein
MGRPARDEPRHLSGGGTPLTGGAQEARGRSLVVLPRMPDLAGEAALLVRVSSG